VVQAMLDTGSELDCVHSRLVPQLQEQGVENLSDVATELQVVGGGTTWASGTLLLDCHVASRDMAKATGHGLARFFFFLESIFINRATLNGTRPNSP
jgi:hypothetical protein